MSEEKQENVPSENQSLQHDSHESSLKDNGHLGQTTPPLFVQDEKEQQKEKGGVANQQQFVEVEQFDEIDCVGMETTTSSSDSSKSNFGDEEKKRGGDSTISSSSSVGGVVGISFSSDDQRSVDRERLVGLSTHQVSQQEDIVMRDDPHHQTADEEDEDMMNMKIVVENYGPSSTPQDQPMMDSRNGEDKSEDIYNDLIITKPNTEYLKPQQDDDDDDSSTFMMKDDDDIDVSVDVDEDSANSKGRNDIDESITLTLSDTNTFSLLKKSIMVLFLQ